MTSARALRDSRRHGGRRPTRTPALCAAAIVFCALLQPTGGAGRASAEPAAPPEVLKEVPIFLSAPVQFLSEGGPSAAPDGVVVSQAGREISASVVVAPPEAPHRIIARVRVEPVPKDEVSVHDPWDRAGNVRLAVDGHPDIELLKFVTSYGGATEHEADVTHLAPLLRGTCRFRGSIDTWLSPAWTLSFSLVFVTAEDRELLDAGSGSVVPDWVVPVLYQQDATAASLGRNGYAVDVEIPEETSRVVLCYLASGHCTDGRDDDEFVSKDNVISVDGVVVERFRPWREDCREFRALNPYTRRWSDGWWSSDYSRSGWCPGDRVRPVRIDLTDHLAPGAHTLTFNVENVRPRDESDHYGYWRLSAYLIGWVDR
jgi:hypothetical protein